MDIEKTIQIHKTMIQKYPYISTCSMSKFLTKVIFNLEKNLPFLVLEKDRVGKIAGKVCKITTGLLKNGTINKDVIVEHSFKVLKELREKDSEMKSLVLTGFLQEIFQLNKNGVLNLSSDSWDFLFLMCSSATDAKTFELVSQCCDAIQSGNTSDVDSILLNSTLIRACGKYPVVFQNVLAVTSSIWFCSEGNVRIQKFLQHLTKAVENLCAGHQFLFYFPENVQHLVMLLATGDLPQTSSYHMLWSIMIRSLELEVCTRNDLVMLMGLYPSWYERLLKEAKEQTSDEAVKFLRLLWVWLCEEEFSEEVKSLTFPITDPDS